MRIRLLVVAALAAGALVLAVPTALADHPHWIDTPAGCKEDIARGQTSKAEDEPGGHKFHENVHTGTPGQFAFARENNPVAVGRDSCP